MDLNSLEKPKYTFHGIYRGVIEDNDDPSDAGRVKIRVFGVWDSPDISIKEIPWAHPALGLQWSGGYNLRNKDWAGGKPNADKGTQYDPGSNSKVAGTDQSALSYQTPSDTAFAEERTDPFMNSCGTGGNFVVPKRGNWVFLFFEGGNSMHPIYFAMAPSERDWKTQSEATRAEVVQKTSQVAKFKLEFLKNDLIAKAKTISLPDIGENWASKALVDCKISVPLTGKLTIPPIIAENPNRDISSITSPNGTTIIMDNRFESEKLYIIHKNTVDHIDEKGNKKLYVGKSYGIPSQFGTSQDTSAPSNYEIGIEGNHEIYIMGKYKLYVNGDIGIKSLGNIQIESAANVGISVASGDVDVIVNNGNVNANIKGNLNANVLLNANIKVDLDCNLKVGKNLSANVLGKTNLTCTGGINLSTLGDFNMTIGGALKISTTSLDITTPVIKTTGEINATLGIKTSGSINAAKDIVALGVVYSTVGIDTGGFLRNRGPVDIGAPAIIHGLQAVGGVGSGSGRPPIAPTPPNPPTPAIPTVKSKDTPVEVTNFTLKQTRSKAPETPVTSA